MHVRMVLYLRERPRCVENGVEAVGSAGRSIMTKDAYLQYCGAIPGAAVDCPFQQERSDLIASTRIARHADTGKWFAAVMEREGAAFVNLKCEPLEASLLRQAFSGIRPGYHMNKQHWVSVYLQSDVPDELICQLTMESFRLTERSKRRGGKAVPK